MFAASVLCRVMPFYNKVNIALHGIASQLSAPTVTHAHSTAVFRSQRSLVIWCRNGPRWHHQGRVLGPRAARG